MDLMCNHVIMLSVFCCVTLQKVVCVKKSSIYKDGSLTLKASDYSVGAF